MMWDALNRVAAFWRTTPHVSPCIVGFGFLLLWGCALTVCIQGIVPAGMDTDPLFGPLAAMPVAKDAFTLAQLVSFAALALFAGRMPPFFQQGWFVIAAHAVGMAAGALVFLATQAVILLPVSVYLASVVIAGAAYSCMYVLWAELLGCLPGNRMIIAYIFATCTYFCLSVFMHYVINPAALALNSALPAITLCFLLASFRSVPIDTLPSKTPRTVNLPWQVVPPIILFATTFDLSGGFVPYSTVDVLIRIGRLVPILVILFLLLFKSEKFDFSHYYGFVVALMVAGIIASFFAGGDEFLTFVLVQAGAESYSMLIFVIVCSYAYRLHVSSARLYSTVAALNLLTQFLASKLQLFSPDLLGGPAVTMTLECLSIGVLIALVRRPDLVYQIQPQPETDDSQDKLVEDAVERVVAEARLSPQEHVVLGYILHDTSTADIAEILFISPSTVRVHIANIYRKTDTHSREQLVGHCGMR